MPGGAIDGTNRVFTLTISPTLLFFQYNSAVLVPGVGGVYTVTLAIAPQPGDTVYASGIV